MNSPERTPHIPQTHLILKCTKFDYRLEATDKISSPDKGLDDEEVQLLFNCVMRMIRDATDLLVPPAEAARLDSENVHANETAAAILKCVFAATGRIPGNPNFNLKLLAEFSKMVKNMRLA